MTADYIENNLPAIIKFENVIEKRLGADTVDKNEFIIDNAHNLRLCKKYGLSYILIDKVYDVEISL